MRAEPERRSQAPSGPLAAGVQATRLADAAFLARLWHLLNRRRRDPVIISLAAPVGPRVVSPRVGQVLPQRFGRLMGCHSSRTEGETSFFELTV